MCIGTGMGAAAVFEYPGKWPPVLTEHHHSSLSAFPSKWFPLKSSGFWDLLLDLQILGRNCEVELMVRLCEEGEEMQNRHMASCHKKSAQLRFTYWP